MACYCALHCVHNCSTLGYRYKGTQLYYLFDNVPATNTGVFVLEQMWNTLGAPVTTPTSECCTGRELMYGRELLLISD
jgi:hypothetical protein